MAVSKIKSSSRSSRRRAVRRSVSTARPPGLGQPVDVEVLRERLKETLTTLARAMDVAYACEGALSHQDAGGDYQIAKVLRLYCGDKIYGAMQQAGQIVLFLDGKGWLDRESVEVGRVIDES
jgi:hypothetical protein